MHDPLRTPAVLTPTISDGSIVLTPTLRDGFIVLTPTLTDGSIVLTPTQTGEPSNVSFPPTSAA